MSDYRFYDLLRARISEVIIEQTQEIGAGLAADFVDYKARVGRVNGLRDALIEAEEIFKKLTG